MADWLDGLILAKARDPKDGRWSGAATAPGTLIAALEDAIGTWIDKYNSRIPDGAPSVIKTTIEGSTAWKDPNNNFLRVRNVRDEVRVVQGNLDAFGDAKSVSGVPVAAWAINGVQRLFLSGSEVSDMDVAVEKLLTPFIRNI